MPASFVHGIIVGEKGGSWDHTCPTFGIVICQRVGRWGFVLIQTRVEWKVTGGEQFFLFAEKMGRVASLKWARNGCKKQKRPTKNGRPFIV
jgi:hypothetical protein